MEPKPEKNVSGAPPEDIKPKGEESIRKASEREAEHYEKKVESNEEPARSDENES